MYIWLCLIAIAVSIIVGWKFKMNTGIIAMVFAFLIGIGAMGLSVRDIIGYWPTNIVFYLISISLFFNYATQNGTMDILGRKILYCLGGNEKAIPLVIFLIGITLGALGAGASTPVIIGPFLFLVGLSAGVHPALIAIAIGFGNSLGGSNMFNGYGALISSSLVDEFASAAGYPTEFSGKMSLYLLINSIIAFGMLFLIAYLVLKGYKVKSVHVDQPEKFDAVQSKNLWVVLLAFLLMVVPTLLAVWTRNPVMVKIADFCQPQVIMFIGSLICSLMKLGDEKKVIRGIPISTIIMIVGVYSLIQVATTAGLIDAMAHILSTAIPKWFVPAFLVLCAAFLSFFSSCTSTVMPLMYPMVPGLSASLGLNPVLLVSCIYLGGLSTAMSPFSTGGALTIASCTDERVKENVLPNQMIAASVLIPILFALMAEAGLFGLLSA